MKHIFLTGGTGVLGQALLTRLPPGPDRHWHILMRADDPERFHARAAKFCRRLGLSPDYVSFYHGDAGLPDLGLAASDRVKILRTCEYYLHAAGDVRLNLTIDQAKALAVGSAQAMLDLFGQSFATHVGRKLLLVSTVGVAGRTPGLIPERQLSGASGFHNTYEQAKHAAEELAFAARDRGVPVEILRPSMIVGDHETGAVSSYQVFYYLANFLAGLSTGGILPRLGGIRLDIIPSDVVTRTIAWSMEPDAQPSEAGVMHLALGPEHSPLVSDLVSQVRRIYREFGRQLPDIQEVPIGEFRRRLPEFSVRSPENREFLIALHYILPYFGEKQTFSADNLLRHHLERRVPIPRWSDYLATILRPYLQYKARE